MRPHPAAHPHYPLIRKYSPPGIDALKTKIAENKIERFMGLNVDLLAHSLSDINEEVVSRYSSLLQNLLLKPSAEM